MACARSATHNLVKIDETLLATVFGATVSRAAIAAFGTSAARAAAHRGTG